MHKINQDNSRDHQDVTRAKMRALRILTRMDKSEADLRAGLNRAGFSSEAVDEAIEYVKSYGYIDDEKYARKYVECYKNRKSRLKLQYELNQKGVAKDTIESALEQCGDSDEKALIRELLNKKWKREYKVQESFEENRRETEKPNQKELNRLFSYLARQGFQNSDIWAVFKDENLI